MIDVDGLTMEDLYSTEDELIRFYRRQGLADGDLRRITNLTKREFRRWRDILRYREKVKKELRSGKF